MVSFVNKHRAFWLAMLFVFTPLGSIYAAEIPIIDAHSQVDHEVDLETIVGLMDKGGVSRVILSPRSKLRTKPFMAFASREAGPDQIIANVGLFSI